MSNSYKDKPTKDSSRFNKNKKTSGKEKYSNESGSGKANSKSQKGYKYSEDAHLDATGRDNDPGYYFVSKELAEQTTQLSFQSFIGLGNIVGAAKMPSMIVVKLNPCPGLTYDYRDAWINSNNELMITVSDQEWANSAVNMSGNKTYTLLASMSGRVMNYQPCDVTMMELAIASIAEFSEHIRRFFGLTLLYNPRNRSLPMQLISNLGIDADDFTRHLSDYRTRFNVQITRLNSIPLLDNIGYIRKSRELYQKIYLDSDNSDMAQLIALRPDSVWMIDESSYSSGTVLKTVYLDQITAFPETMDDYLTLLENMITALLNSTTLNLIYSDLIHVATKITVPMWQFDYLGDLYGVKPEYNRNFLLQFHNMTIVDRPLSYDETNTDDYGTTTPKPWQTVTYHGSDTMKVTNSNDVASDGNTGYVVYNPVFENSGVINIKPSNRGIASDVIIDMDTGSPNLVDRIEATRFTVGALNAKIPVKVIPNASSTVDCSGVFTLTDHYITSMTIFTNDPGTSPVVSCNMGSTSAFRYIAAYLEKFDWAPLYKEANSNGVVDMVYGDLNYFTLVDWKYLLKVNTVEYQGLFEFRIGTIGKN